MAYNVKFLKGTQAQFDAIASKDVNTFYYVGTDLYLGNVKLSNGADLAAALVRVGSNETAIAQLQKDIGALTGGDTSVSALIESAISELENGAVKDNADAIATLNGAVTEDGSVLKIAKDAADAKDTAIAAAKKAGEDAQSDVDALEQLVGTIPADATATTVVAYAKEVADAAAGNASQVAADLATQVTRAKAAEKANADAIAKLNGTGEGSVAKAIDDAFDDFSTKVSDDAVVNTYKELIDYAAANGSEMVTLTGKVSANETAIANEVKRAGDEEARIEGLITAEATTARAAEKANADAIAAINHAETGILKTAKNYADGLDSAMDARVDALEEALGANGSVAEQITAEIQKLDVDEVGGAGKYIKSIKEVDGKITAVAGDAIDFDAAGDAAQALVDAKAYVDTALTWAAME